MISSVCFTRLLPYSAYLLVSCLLANTTISDALKTELIAWVQDLVRSYKMLPKYGRTKTGWSNGKFHTAFFWQHSFVDQYLAVYTVKRLPCQHISVTLSGPGGWAQRSGWSNSQLPIRNLLLRDAQTFRLLVFVFKTCSDQILAKLISQGVVAALFSSTCPKNLKNEKIFLHLEIAEMDMGVNFGSRRAIMDIKTHFF